MYICLKFCKIFKLRISQNLLPSWVVNNVSIVCLTSKCGVCAAHSLVKQLFFHCSLPFPLVLQVFTTF